MNRKLLNGYLNFFKDADDCEKYRTVILDEFDRMDARIQKLRDICEVYASLLTEDSVRKVAEYVNGERDDLPNIEVEND